MPMLPTSLNGSSINVNGMFTTSLAVTDMPRAVRIRQSKSLDTIQRKTFIRIQVRSIGEQREQLKFFELP